MICEAGGYPGCRAGIVSPVIARPAIQLVGAKPAVQKVVAAVAKQDVVAGKPVDRVVSGRDAGYLVKPDRYNAAVACAMKKVVAAGAGYVRHFLRPFYPLAAYVGAVLSVVGLIIELDRHPCLPDPAYHPDHGEPAVQHRTPCCMDRGCGRTEPDPCSGHAMRTYFGRPSSSIRFSTSAAMATLARLSPVRLRTEPITDDALPARDIGLHQGAPVVP